MKDSRIVEICLIILAVIVTLVSTTVYFLSTKKGERASVLGITEDPVPHATSFVMVDLSGAVVHPNIYKLKSGARISDLLITAGGLSKKADLDFFARNFNLSRLLSDQDKIYVPSKEEVISGIFTQSSYRLDYLKPKNSDETTSSLEYIGATSTKVNLNTASVSELDSLSGIGFVLAQKIISNRPYTKLKDLTDKKVLNSTQLETIKNNITF